MNKEREKGHVGGSFSDFLKVSGFRTMIIVQDQMYSGPPTFPQEHVF